MLMVETQRFLTPRQFGELAGLSSSSVARGLANGTIPKIKFSRRVLIPYAYIAKLEAEALASMNGEA